MYVRFALGLLVNNDSRDETTRREQTLSKPDILITDSGPQSEQRQQTVALLVLARGKCGSQNGEERRQDRNWVQGSAREKMRGDVHSRDAGQKWDEDDR